MQNRWLTVFMVFLILLQPVVSLASVCDMVGASVQNTLASIHGSDSSTTSGSVGQDAGQPACHEKATLDLTKATPYHSCAGGQNCAAACSVLSSTVAYVYRSTAITPTEPYYQNITRVITSPSPSQLYRPPRLS